MDILPRLFPTLILFVLLGIVPVRRVQADSVVYLHNGSIYIGTQMPGSGSDILLLKTDLGNIGINRGKISRVVENTDTLPDVTYHEGTGGSVTKGKLLETRDGTTVVLEKGKIIMVEASRIDSGATPFGGGIKPEKREAQKNRYLEGGVATITFPFSKIRKDNGKVESHVSRRLWGVRMEGAYLPIPFLCLELSAGYYTLLEKETPVPFGAPDRIVSLQESISLYNVSPAVYFRLRHSSIGIGTSYNQQWGTIDYTYRVFVTGSIVSRTIEDRKRSLSYRIIFRQEIPLSEGNALVPGIEYAIHSIAQKKYTVYDTGFFFGMRMFF